jgi:broad specificity phosphatase PhoE
MNDIVLGLLRHGQTDWNIDMRLQGISDIPLNEHGRMQARNSAPKIALGNWDLILTSPLSRAVETAEIVSTSIADAELKVQELLLERSFGVAEGLTYEQWREQFGSLHHADGAESIEELTTRVQEMLKHLVETYPGKRILAVSHGAFIRRVINVVSNGELPHEGDRFGNASLSVLAHSIEGWHVVDFNPIGLGD